MDRRAVLILRQDTVPQRLIVGLASISHIAKVARLGFEELLHLFTKRHIRASAGAHSVSAGLQSFGRGLSTSAGRAHFVEVVRRRRSLIAINLKTEFGDVH